jgi:tetratricopeptide (TPR) repeat protein
MYWKFSIFLLFSACSFQNQNFKAEENEKLDSLYHSALELSEQYLITDPSKALEWAHEALAYSDLLPPNRRFSPLVQLGELYMRNGVYDIATHYFIEYLSLAESQHDLNKEMIGLLNLGALNIELSRYAEAENYYFALIEQMNKLSSPEKEEALKKYSFAYAINLGLIYSEKENYQEAEYFFKRAEELLEKYELEDTKRVNFFLNYAYLQLKREEIVKAREYYLLSKELSVKLGNRSSEKLAEQGLVSCWIKEGAYEEALPVALFLYDEALTTENKKQQLVAAKFLIDIYENKFQPQEVLFYTRAMGQLESELASTDSEMALLKRELESKANRNREDLEKNYSFRLLGIAFLLVISFLIVGYLVFQLKRVRRKATKINTDRELLTEKVLERDKKLITQGLLDIQKDNLIQGIIEDIQNKEVGSLAIDFSAAKIKKLNSNLEGEGWRDFEIRFQNVYPDFFKRLNHSFPGLTPNERRLCAFLLLDMNTKEIVNITGQSIRAIEIARARLRKKLNLTHSSMGLYELLSQI